MLILWLILAIIAVILSPIAIDWYLNLREVQQERRAWRARQQKARQLARRSSEPLTISFPFETSPVPKSAAPTSA